MEFDFAIIYFGLTRSTKKVYKSHIDNIFNVLKQNQLTYKTFMHTWKTKDNRQTVWDKIIPQEIDYDEYKLLEPAVYKIDKQEDYTQNMNMDDFFYKDVWDTKGHCGEGEWLPGLILNHLCALESKKRGLEMVEESMQTGNKYKYIMFIRPDCLIKDELPLSQILPNLNKINIQNEDHGEGYNDRFAITNYENAVLYGKRINEIAEFRKTNGRIVSEKYVKFIINKYKIPVNFIDFDFQLIRP